MDTIDIALGSLKFMNTTNAFLSAMRTFGKYGAGGRTEARRLKLSNISVKSTAYARRKKVLRGSAPGEAGRPRRNALGKDNMHSYTMPGRGNAAPHNLGVCVRRNVLLGKTHSKK